MFYLVDVPVLLLLIPLAFAAGVDLYLTLLLLGVAARTGWGGGLPGNLPDLGVTPLLTMAATFYLLEFVAERPALASLFWNAVHALIRLLGAALLVAMALPGAPWQSRVLLGVAAAILAFLGHSGRFGTRQLLRLAAARPPSFVLVSLAEDAVTLGLVALALDFPPIGAAVTLALGVLVATVGRPAMRAALFGVRLAWGVGWGILSEHRWHPPGAFPRWIRRGWPGDALAPGGSLRGAPAAGWRVPGGGAFRVGWIVITGSGPFFVYRRILGVRSCPLHDAAVRRVVERAAFHRVELQDGAGRLFSLLIPRDGPAPDVLRGEFRRGEPAGSSPGSAPG
jgi:hypothetical protein